MHQSCSADLDKTKIVRDLITSATAILRQRFNKHRKRTVTMTTYDSNIK